MDLPKLEEDLESLASTFDPAAFGPGLMAAYDLPAAMVAKWRESPYDPFGKGLVEARRLAYAAARPGEVGRRMAELVERHGARPKRPAILFATDGSDFACMDTRMGESREGRLSDIADHAFFLMPVSDIGKRMRDTGSGYADIQASTRIERLCLALMRPEEDERGARALNTLMTRIMFCLFADGSGLFENRLFASTLQNGTKTDGSDTAAFLDDLFRVLDAPPGSPTREQAPLHLKKFDYVNGGLFAGPKSAPPFSAEARRLLASAACLNWSSVNPDVLGSMVQGIVGARARRNQGIHYTSPANIMKVIRPAFLDSLDTEVASATTADDLRGILRRIRSVRVFDPACGSGNFLVVTYRELRRLESEVVARLVALGDPSDVPETLVSLESFVGIELNAFAAETARLSLWIARQQANALFREAFKAGPPDLPLVESASILTGNATREDWLAVCPPSPDREVHVVGNPPFTNSRAKPDPAQKEDMDLVFRRFPKVRGGYRNLDYVSAWIMLAADYVAKAGPTATATLVTTSSVVQGSQAGKLWEAVDARGAERFYAHTSFKWTSALLDTAGVECVIVGLRGKDGKGPKRITDSGITREVGNISPQLTDDVDTYVHQRNDPLGSLHPIAGGHQPIDGKHLIFEDAEVATLLEFHPEARRFLRKFYGSEEILSGKLRWCLLIDDAGLAEANAIPPLRDRLAAVARARKASMRAHTRKLAAFPHRFGHPCRRHDDHVIAIPLLSSERYSHIAVELLDTNAAISNQASGLFDAPMHMFAIASSLMMRTWCTCVGGKMKTDPRFTNHGVWNTFPMPEISDAVQDDLVRGAWDVLEAREAHPGASLSSLYQRGAMPANLAEAHARLDATMDAVFDPAGFRDNDHRRTHLLERYRTLVAGGSVAVGGVPDGNQGAFDL